MSRELQKCFVKGCKKRADYEVIFYDVRLLPHHSEAEVFYERHNSCPLIYDKHMQENELSAETGLPSTKLREYGGKVDYRHTKSAGFGFVIYRPLNT